MTQNGMRSRRVNQACLINRQDNIHHPKTKHPKRHDLTLGVYFQTSLHGTGAETIRMLRRQRGEPAFP